MRNWVLVRGIKQDQRHWRGVPEALSAATGGEVLCLDHPGTGTEAHRAAPATVAALADDLRARWLRVRGDGDWGLVGLSLGGMVVLSWAARHPDGVGVVAIGNTSAGGLSPLYHRMLPRVMATLPRLLTMRDVAARELAVLRLTTTTMPDDARASLAKEFALLHGDTPFRPAVLARQLKAGASFRWPARPAMPVHVLSGRGDRFVDPRCSDALASHLGATLHTHPEAGHDLGLDAPAWLVERLASLS